MNTATHHGTSENGGQPSFPKVLSYVGVIWIVFGAINLIGVLALALLVLLSVVPFPNGEGVTDLLLILAAGIGLVYIGVQTTRGTASDTLENGIGSIIWGVILLYKAFKSADGLAQLTDATVGAFVLLVVCGAMMVVAGWISLAVRKDYRAWRGSIAAAVVDAETSFLDSQFIRMSPIGLCLLPLCLPPIAVLLGLVGFFLGRHPVARKRAVIMAVVGAIWPLAVIVWFLST
jgi:hypothetical protein